MFSKIVPAFTSQNIGALGVLTPERNMLHLETDAIGTIGLLRILFDMEFSCIFF